jgi:SAM-dependent methyltransferase
MAHSQQAEFFSLVARFYPSQFHEAKVLEVGALDINGSVRPLFERCEYVGVDLDLGAGVDVVSPGQLLDFPTFRFDTSISAECFEHNPFWSETVANMFRMTRPGGLVTLSCATIGRKEHGTTRSSPESSPFTVAKRWDYYRNLNEKDFARTLHLAGWCSDYRFAINYESYDLYFVGIRSGGGQTQLPSALLGEMLDRYRPFRTLRSARRALKVWLLGGWWLK